MCRMYVQPWEKCLSVDEEKEVEVEEEFVEEEKKEEVEEEFVEEEEEDRIESKYPEK